MWASRSSAAFAGFAYVLKKMETKVQSPNNRCCLFCPNHEFGWHYNDVGHGRPLILLHGIGMSHVAWKMVVPNLAKERRVLAFDIAGFGSTPSLTDIRQTPIFRAMSIAQSRITARSVYCWAA